MKNHLFFLVTLTSLLLSAAITSVDCFDNSKSIDKSDQHNSVKCGSVAEKNKSNFSSASNGKNAKILVLLELDNKPEETSWRIEDVFGEVVFESSKTRYNASQRFETVAHIVELKLDETYVFFLSATFAGRVVIYLGNKASSNQLIGYHDYFSNGSHFFFEASSGGILDDFFPVDSSAENNPSPFDIWPGSLSKKKSLNLQTLALFVLTTDSHPRDIEWFLSTDVESSNVILRIPRGSYQLPFTKYSLLLSLELEESYKLTICNKSGDSFEGKLVVYLAEQEDTQRILVDYNGKEIGCNSDPIIFKFSERDFIIPTTAPTPLPPAPFLLCEICGSGRKVNYPGNIVELTKDVYVRCGTLEIIGIEGFISDQLCASLPSLLGNACACEETIQDPSELPSVTPSHFGSTEIPDTPSQPHLNILLPSQSPSFFNLESSPGYPVCNICGEGNQILNPEFLLDVFAGHNKRFNCGQVEQSANNGFLSPIICNAFFKEKIEESGCICGKKHDVPSLSEASALPSAIATSMPSPFPSMIGKPTQDKPSLLPSNYNSPESHISPVPSSHDFGDGPRNPPCDICGEGYVLSNPELVLNVFTADETSFTCGQIVQEGILGFIMPMMCNTIFNRETIEALGCVCSQISSETPSRVPSMPPSSSPYHFSSMPSSYHFGNSPNHPACYVCGEGKTISNPDLLLDVFAGDNTFFTCGKIEEAGLKGFLSPIICGMFFKANLEEAGCVCEDQPSDLFVNAVSVSPTKEDLQSDNNFEDKVPEPIPEGTGFWT